MEENKENYQENKDNEIIEIDYISQYRKLYEDAISEE